MTKSQPRRSVLSRGSWTETARVAEVLRQETVGGGLLLLATAVAMTWANSPWADAISPCATSRWGRRRYTCT